MPGVFGFTQKCSPQLSKLSELGQLNIHTDNRYHIRKDYVRDGITNCVVSFDFMRSYNFHYEINNMEIWIYGDPLVDGLTGEKALHEVARISAQALTDFSKIASIDGLFTIIIWYKVANKLFIVGDRNGLSHLYFGIFDGQLIWGSELRAFLTKSISTTIRKESLTAYLELGYLIGNATWFNEISLLPPASYIEWNVEDGALKKIASYWNHMEFNVKSIQKDENKIVSDLAELFAQAVSKRIAKDERVGITLSGGKDSRAILANIPYRDNGLVAITRGIKGCGDVKLASQAAKLRKDCTHIIKEMSEDNWLDGRVEAILATSGQKDLLNMNAIGSLSLHKNYFDINLDGAGGDGIFGGGHLKYENKENAKVALKVNYLKAIFTNNDNTLSELFEYYKHINSDQYFYTYERVRRFTVMGSVLGHDYGIISRFPFLDHQLQEYLFLLPKETDFGRLYNKMLIKYFPEYFVKIDNLTTGSRLFISNKLNYFSQVLRYIQKKAGVEKYRTIYHDYPNWIKYHDRGLLEQFIYLKDQKLFQYIDPHPVKVIIDDFSKTGNQTGMISRIITLNIFLEHYLK